MKGRKRREAEANSFNRLRASLEGRVRASLTKLFNRTAEQAATRFEEGGAQFALRAVETFEVKLNAILLPHYRRTYQAFGDYFREGLKESAGFETKEQGNVLDEFELRTRFYMNSVGGRKIVQISNSTRTSIMRAIAQGEAAGDSIPEISKRIRAKVGGKIGKARARTIARTETHSAANSATFDAAEASGLEGVFEWMSIQSERTRSTHWKADGQRKPKGERFKVGAVELRFPGDPFGPAHEVINCRCSLGFRPGEDVEPEPPATPYYPERPIEERLLNEHGVNFVDPKQVFGRNLFGRKHGKEAMQEVMVYIEDELKRLKDAGYPDIAKNVMVATNAAKVGSWGQATGAFSESYFNMKLPRFIAMQSHASLSDIARTHQNINQYGQPWSVKTKDKEGHFLGATFRHELGHTLTSPMVVSRFKEVAGRLYYEQKKFKTPFDQVSERQKVTMALEWFRMNVSEYSAANLQESIAEAFARYTAANYVKGELPQQFEELLEIMAQGKLPNRDANGKLIGVEPSGINNFGDFSMSDPQDMPKPGQRVKSKPEQFDENGNYIPEPFIEDQGLQFEDIPEQSVEDQLREELGEKD